jgi:hypothetical protein
VHFLLDCVRSSRSFLSGSVLRGKTLPQSHWAGSSLCLRVSVVKNFLAKTTTRHGGTENQFATDFLGQSCGAIKRELIITLQKRQDKFVIVNVSNCPSVVFAGLKVTLT